MPLQPVRKAKQTVSYRPVAHRTENVTVLSQSPPAPVVEATPGAAGSLNDATYTYQVTALTGTLEGPPSEEAEATTTAGAGAGSVTLTWTAVPGATSYNVYGRTGTIELLANVAVATYEDDGSATPDGALPTSTDEVNLRIPYGDNVTGIELGTAVGEYRNRYSNPGV